MKLANEDLREGLPPEDVLKKLRIPFVHKAALTRGGVTEERFIVDVGLAGVFVERPEALAVGEAVVVSFQMPGNAIPIVSRCRVAWNHTHDHPLSSKHLPPGVGLQFVELSERDGALIREHVEAYCRQPARVRRFLRHWPDAERAGDDP